MTAVVQGQGRTSWSCRQQRGLGPSTVYIQNLVSSLETSSRHVRGTSVYSGRRIAQNAMRPRRKTFVFLPDTRCDCVVTSVTEIEDGLIQCQY